LKELTEGLDHPDRSVVSSTLKDADKLQSRGPSHGHQVMMDARAASIDVDPLLLIPSSRAVLWAKTVGHGLLFHMDRFVGGYRLQIFHPNHDGHVAKSWSRKHAPGWRPQNVLVLGVQRHTDPRVLIADVDRGEDGKSTTSNPFYADAKSAEADGPHGPEVLRLSIERADGAAKDQDPRGFGGQAWVKRPRSSQGDGARDLHRCSEALCAWARSSGFTKRVLGTWLAGTESTEGSSS
jgi:hypothetical protein